ncbi:hypothetical protein CP520_03615 [Mesoplasma lactucae ATCC 49193]|uniref:Aquaporin n=2 Tax=Mesoplasma lactucae TaxID=138853 RepID=A0A291ISZ8_9MOLU|nr:hypothetical protein CP520_03615 [Mesoplasma lactucae ATCC 49193]
MTGTWSLEGVSGNSYIGWIFLSEMIGSFLLILIGNGVVACSNLTTSKGRSGGWTAVIFGWMIAVFLGALASQYSNAHMNFAVSLAVLIQSSVQETNVFAQGHEWLIIIYLLGQFTGMFIAQIIVDLVYWLQIEKSDPLDILAMHCTSPAQSARTKKTYFFNFFAEFVGTFVLVVGITAASFYLNKNGVAGKTHIEVSALASVGIAAVVVGAVGFGLGGPTGFAINPTRDLAPRVVHQIMPLPNKGTSDWAYSWVPIVGPILGACTAAALTLPLIN